MAQPIRDRAMIDTSRDEMARVCMPQIMEPNVRQVEPFETRQVVAVS